MKKTLYGCRICGFGPLAAVHMPCGAGTKLPARQHFDHEFIPPNTRLTPEQMLPTRLGYKPEKAEP